MTNVKRLPSRLVSTDDLAALDEEERLQVASYGGIPDGENIEIYAIKVATDETAHALGFDDSRGRWQQLAAVDGANLAAADQELDAVLDDWIQDKYGDRFEVRKVL